MNKAKSQATVSEILDKLWGKLPENTSYADIANASNGAVQAQLVRKVFATKKGKKETIEKVILWTKNYLTQEEERLNRLKEMVES